LDYKLISDKALEVFIECEIHEFPIDCFAILKHYGFKVHAYSYVQKQNPMLFEMCKRYSNDSFKYQDIICYNQNHNESRVRFSLMHELGHYILEHEENTPENEAEADCFASSVLAPRVAIWRMWHPTAEEIHQRFGLSYAASNRALDNFNRRKIYGLCDSEKKLVDWLYPPDIVIEKKKKPVCKERHRRHKKEWAEIEARNKFIEECYGCTTDFALEQHERSLHLGHSIYNI